MTPRAHQPMGNEYQPRFPPIPTTTCHSAAGAAVDARSRMSV